MRRSAALLALFLVACATGCSHGSAPSTDGRATVVRLIDGDTVVVQVGGREEHVRLIGIDTPETHKPGTPVECYGPEAAARLAATDPAGHRRAARARSRGPRRLREAARVRVPRHRWDVRRVDDGARRLRRTAVDRAQHRAHCRARRRRHPTRGPQAEVCGARAAASTSHEAGSVHRRDDARGAARLRARRSPADHQLRRPRFELRGQRRLLRSPARGPGDQLHA